MSKRDRSHIVMQMILTRKGGSMRDRKKEARRKACRKPLAED